VKEVDTGMSPCSLFPQPALKWKKEKKFCIEARNLVKYGLGVESFLFIQPFLSSFHGIQFLEVVA